MNRTNTGTSYLVGLSNLLIKRIKPLSPSGLSRFETCMAYYPLLLGGGSSFHQTIAISLERKSIPGTQPDIIKKVNEFLKQDEGVGLAALVYFIEVSLHSINKNIQAYPDAAIADIHIERKEHFDELLSVYEKEVGNDHQNARTQTARAAVLARKIIEWIFE